MGSRTIIRDVCDTLKKVLLKKIPELTNESSIVFDSPADVEATTTARLAVFLYNVVENSYLKNTGPQPVGLTQMQDPPLVSDFHFIFTPYAQSRETEYIILEGVMQTFHGNPVLRSDVLQGNLKASGNTEIRIIPGSLSLDELNKLWGIFPNKAYKLSVSYILTPLWIPSETKKDITRVTEKEISIYDMGKSK